jgi:iron complex outermembrane receptor protein
LSSEYVLTDFGTAIQYRNPSYTRTDLSLTYNAPEDRFYVQGYIQNLEDTIRLQNLDSFGNATPTDPRTFGVRAGVRF